MAEASMDRALAREFERELGVPSVVAKEIASDVSSKVRLRLANPPCPKCGGAFPRSVQPGERTQCPFCRSWFTVEDATERAVDDVLKDYDKISQQFVQRIQVLFSSNVEAIMGKLAGIETTTTKTLAGVLETQSMVQVVLNRLNVPLQLPSASVSKKRGPSIDVSARAETSDTNIVNSFEKMREGAGADLFRGLDLETLIRFGNVHFNNNEYGKALSYYERAVAIAPNNYSGWFNRGVVYYRMGDYRKAIEMNEKAVNIKPDDAGAWNNMGLAYENVGDRVSARRCYLRAQEEAQKAGDATSAEKYRVRAAKN